MSKVILEIPDECPQTTDDANGPICNKCPHQITDGTSYSSYTECSIFRLKENEYKVIL